MVKRGPYQNQTLSICPICKQRTRSGKSKAHARTCEVCGSKFCDPNGKKKVCSASCRSVYLSQCVRTQMENLRRCDLCGRKTMGQNQAHKVTCPVCGKLFCQKYGQTRLTCSEACRRASQSEKVSSPTCDLCGKSSARNGQFEHKRTCEVCGSPFCGHGTTCSKKCRYEKTFPVCERCGRKVRGGSKLHNLTCVICGNLFCSTYPRKTCSRDCRYKLVSQSKMGHAPEKGSGWGKGGYLEGTQIWMRSTWERNYAWILRLQGKSWRYEESAFEMADKSVYYPDFYVDGDGFVEIKGWESDDWQVKLDKFRAEYPNTSLVVVSREDYKRLRQRYKDQIPEWEDDGLG